ncbi:hypothetical protein SLA2020_337880 [Shorea laevis]
MKTLKSIIGRTGPARASERMPLVDCSFGRVVNELLNDSLWISTLISSSKLVFKRGYLDFAGLDMFQTPFRLRTPSTSLPNKLT